MTTAEAGVLQTYERPFEWRGAKTKQFLQIGNAVPPVLARAVLAALITDTTDLKGHSRDSAKQLITTG
jgi:site-specific DNA-cytosine methylase